MLKIGDLVRYKNGNSAWNGTLWRVCGFVGSFRDASVSLEQAYMTYSPGYKAVIAVKMLQLERKRGGFGKWFKEHRT